MRNQTERQMRRVREAVASELVNPDADIRKLARKHKVSQKSVVIKAFGTAQ